MTFKKAHPRIFSGLVGLGWIGLSQLAGIIGAFFTQKAIPGWYATLEKPPLTPPSEVFGPVWITLYTLIGISMFLVWRLPKSTKGRSMAFALFAVQWILNIAWSILFFGVHALLGSIVEIGFLLISIVAMLVVFARLSKIAAVLLIPYLAWVSFATYLTFAFWQRNSL